ncbi:hypothetical protein RJ641_019822 [Dillenia turbinata]|uniref:NAD(P)-binding domain-containing protein n=1 Tax=Dillenia turbinata TaxID=194707 RepID=A0AAN8UFR4_9MAGN
MDPLQKKMIYRMVILSLIVKRNRVKALVKDKQAAIEAFGIYVEKWHSDYDAKQQSNARKLAEKDESMVMASGIPYTIIRAGLLQNTPGGKHGFRFKEGSAAKGNLSEEDLLLYVQRHSIRSHKLG